MHSLRPVFKYNGAVQSISKGCLAKFDNRKQNAPPWNITVKQSSRVLENLQSCFQGGPPLAMHPQKTTNWNSLRRQTKPMGDMCITHAQIVWNTHGSLPKNAAAWAHGRRWLHLYQHTSQTTPKPPNAWHNNEAEYHQSKGHRPPCLKIFYTQIKFKD